MSARPIVLALARLEGRRLLRHPFILTGAALPIVVSLLVILSADDHPVHNDYPWLFAVPFLPLAAAVLVAVNLAALRARRDDAEELYRSCPAPATARSLAHLASLAWAVAAAALLVAIVVLSLMSRGGPLAGISLILAAPAIVTLCGALALATARWLPHPAAAPIAVVGLLTVLGNVSPGDRSGGVLPVLGLVVLAILVGALALLRDRERLT